MLPFDTIMWDTDKRSPTTGQGGPRGSG